MDELVFDAIDGNFHVHRQLPYETEDFGTSIQTNMFKLLMGDSTTVLIPMSSLFPIGILSFISRIPAMSYRLKHHILILYKLSRVLGCDIEDLLENPMM